MTPIVNDVFEDALAYLPCSEVKEFGKKGVVYELFSPATNFYLLIEGMVKITRTLPGGRKVLVEIYRPDEFFGEASLIPERKYGETATALEHTKLMVWSKEQVLEVMIKQSRLGVALAQLYAQRLTEFSEHIEQLGGLPNAHKMVHVLLHFANRFGKREDDGSLLMPPFTQELFGQYAGITREIVTQHMNRLRRAGCIRYSRQYIRIYSDSLYAWMREYPY